MKQKLCALFRYIMSLKVLDIIHANCDSMLGIQYMTACENSVNS